MAAFTHAPSKDCAYTLKQTLRQCLIDKETETYLQTSEHGEHRWEVLMG